MEKLSMCRICLIKDVRLHCLVNTNLQEIYEYLSGNLLETKDRRPLHACYMCCARLGNCLRLRTACLHSEELFSHLLENDSWAETPSDMSMLQRVPVTHMNVYPVVHRELNIHPSPETDEQQNEDWAEDLQDNDQDQGIYTQFVKEEDMKSENVNSKDEELDYSIRSIKVQASDNSCVGDSTRESYISKSNPSISSVDFQDISAKTVKIVLHQMDLNTATVTKHLKPTDLEYTSQCNNFNYSENVKMLRPNICKEYKQIVHTSSKTHCSPHKHIRTRTGDTIYKCCLCEKIFSKKSVLKVHFRTHNDEKPHMCDRCGRSFTHKYTLLVHIRSHTGEKPYRCSTCDKSFNQRIHLTRHILIHTGEKPYNCDTCGKAFRRTSDLSRHIRTHTGEKPHKCFKCSKGFITKSDLSSHFRIHTGEKPFKCDTCGKCFCHKKSWSDHISAHTGEKPYKCDTCGKCFRYKYPLSEHISTHTGEKPCKCETCGKGFRRKCDLSRHIRIHTNKKPNKIML